MTLARRSTLLALSIFAATTASADDWVAAKLRGQVLQQIETQWVPLKRGDVVSDNRFIRTLGSGHVVLTRGGETVSLAPNTKIRIEDRPGAKPFTTVTEAFGTVSVEANVEAVKHFAVQTPFLAAVVKGTRFVVTSSQAGSSVDVQRGHVEVDDPVNRTHTTISVGQSATLNTQSTKGTIVVSGRGTLPKVLDQRGNPVNASDPKATAKAAKAAVEAAKIARQKTKDAAQKAAKGPQKAAEKLARDATKAALMAIAAGAADRPTPGKHDRGHDNSGHVDGHSGHGSSNSGKGGRGKHGD